MKKRSIACLIWVAVFLLLAIGCGIAGYNNGILGYYSIGFVALAWQIWKSEGYEERRIGR